MNTFTLPSSAAPNTSSPTSCVTSFATSCAASFTCSSFTCHLRAGVGGGTCVLGVGSKAALAADRTSSGVGLASGSPRAAAYLGFLFPEGKEGACSRVHRPPIS